jgi:hypothetical protein
LPAAETFAAAGSASAGEADATAQSNGAMVKRVFFMCNSFQGLIGAGLVKRPA